jgi:hypothetical protein
MKNNPLLKTQSAKRRVGITIGILALLMMPLVAMQFTDEVQWTAFDFIVAGALLLALGFSIEIIIRHVQTATFRIVALMLVLLVFLFLWAELAVGIIGTPLGGD